MSFVPGILVEKAEHITNVESHIFLQLAKFEEAERIRIEEEKKRLEQERLEAEKKRAGDEDKRKQELERKADIQRKLNDVINESQHLLDDMKVEEEKAAEAARLEQKLDISEREIEIIINKKSEDNPDAILQAEKVNNSGVGAAADSTAREEADVILDHQKTINGGTTVDMTADASAPVHKDAALLQQFPEECSESGQQQSLPDNTEQHIPAETEKNVQKSWEALKADSKSAFIKMIMEGYSVRKKLFDHFNTFSFH